MSWSLKLYTEAVSFYFIIKAVAEYFVNCLRLFERIFGDNKRNNADMSNTKYCVNQYRCKSKVFVLFLYELFGF